MQILYHALNPSEFQVKATILRGKKIVLPRIRKTDVISCCFPLQIFFVVHHLANCVALCQFWLYAVYSLPCFCPYSYGHQGQ